MKVAPDFRWPSSSASTNPRVSFESARCTLTTSAAGTTSSADPAMAMPKNSKVCTNAAKAPSSV